MSKNKTKNVDLTDKEFWRSYWNSKNLVYKINDSIKLGSAIKSAAEDTNAKSFIEIGGFPGYYSIFANKYVDLNATLFDYFIDEEIINRLLRENELGPESMEIVEGDIFTYEFSEKYDIVFSAGLIEHFWDLKQIINAHFEICKPGGTVIIGVPNFLGVNGIAQYIWHRSNFKVHNLKAMKPNLIASLVEEIGGKNFRSAYVGKHNIHMDNYDDLSSLGKKSLALFRRAMASFDYRIGSKSFCNPTIVYAFNK